jgi:hypothetical protein
MARVLARPVSSYIFSEQRRCLLLDARRAIFGKPPSLSCWLSTHPNVAAALKWQFTFQTSAYDVPETAKRTWPSWSGSEQTELIAAFESAWNWLYASSPFTNLNETIVYPPANLADTSDPAGSPWVQISPAAARELYLRWLGLNFAVELGGHVPWSVTGYTAEQLQILFDSASFLSMSGGGNYNVCAGSPEHTNYVKRKDNLGGSLIAPPRFTLAFLRNSSLVGATRQATIANLLNWARDNLVHFFGAASYQTMEQHWQYRGLPPISRVISGTTSTFPNTTPAFARWTAGCHGTTGFLRNVLRAVNIPVQILRVCGHGQARFLTEGTYLDHGDNPYNLGFKAAMLPASDLLINDATYTAWFGTSLDNHETNCGNVGRRAMELTP